MWSSGHTRLEGGTLRQGIIPSISQIAGLELTDRVYAVAGDDDDPAGLTGVAQDNDDE